MNDTRVILLTVAGPGGHVDVGVRADVTPADLAVCLGQVVGIDQAASAAELWSAPRPGGPAGRRTMIYAGVPLAQAGVLDGDVVLFTPAGDPRSAERGSTIT